MLNENGNPKTDAEMSVQFKSLQTKSLIGKILLIGGFAAAAVCVYLNVLPAVIGGIIIAVLGGVLIKKSNMKIKLIAGSGILRQVLSDVFDDVDYRPFEHLSEGQIESACFRFSYDRLEGNDYVRAKYNGLNIEMSDIALISVDTDSDGDTHESYVFRGLWLICDFGKELSANVRVCERSKFGKLLGKGGLMTENAAFNKQFRILSEKDEEAFYILTPHMMEYIIQMDRMAKARTNLSFLRKGKLHIALDSGRDMFEVKGRMTDPAMIRKQFYYELRQVTDLIDELRLVKSAFK